MFTLHANYKKFFKKISKNLQHQKLTVFDYARKKDFDGLWMLVDSSTEPNQVPNHIIIVWEKTYGTDTNPLLTSYLTPMDWALVYSAKIPVGKPIPFIYIVDLTGKVHNEWAMQPEQRSGLLKNMPWVRLYAPLIPESDLFREGYQPIATGELAPSDGPLLLITEEGETLTATLNLRTDPSVLSEKQKRELIKLAKELKNDNNLSRSGDHHDINNLIGPALFICDGIYGALARRVCFDDVPFESDVEEPPFEDQNESEQKPSFQNFVETEGLQTPDNLRIVVVDDYIDKGWKSAFRSYFGTKHSKTKLLYIANPTNRIQNIKKMIKNSEHTQECWNYSFFNTDKAQTNAEKKVQEILFFDLRLFPRQGDRISTKEKNYFNRVCSLASALEKKKFFLEEVEKIKEWLKPNDLKAETKVHRKALTLLPRILSTIDPSYPIILFSATGRRDIMESVRPFRNIITSFEKPDLDTLSSTPKRQTALYNFEDSLRKSLKIIHARKHCQALQMDGSKTLEGGGGEAANEEKKKQKYHIELFIDESGLGPGGLLPPWRVGGCFALFSGETLENAQKKADVFDDELVNAGVIYTEYQQRIGNPAKAAKQKARGCALLLDGLRRTSSNKPDQIGLVSIQGKGAYTDHETPFFLYGDRSFLNPFEILVEGFLYDALPQIAASIKEKPENITINVFAATRTDGISRKIYNEQGGRGFFSDDEWLEIVRTVRTHESARGMQYNPNYEEGQGIFWRSFNPEHLAPIVQRMVEQRREFRKITRGLVVPLVKRLKENKLPNKFIPFLCRQCKVRCSLEDLSEIETLRRILPQQPDSTYGLQGGGQLWINSPANQSRKKIRHIGLKNFDIKNIENIEIRDRVKVLLPIIKPALLKATALLIVKFEKKFLQYLKPYEEYDANLDVKFMESLAKYLQDQDGKLPWGLPQPVTCPHCNLRDTLRLDIRALHYVADQILTKCFEDQKDKDRKYKSQHNYTVFDEPGVGEFVDVVDDDLIEIMQLSKQIDMDGPALAKAIADFPLSKPETGAKFDSNSKAARRPSLREIVAQRAAGKLPSLSQDDFFIIVDDLEQKRRPNGN